MGRVVNVLKSRLFFALDSRDISLYLYNSVSENNNSGNLTKKEI